MKKNYLYIQIIGVVFTTLFGFTSCQQEEYLNSPLDETAISRSENNKVIWEINTTETGAGKLDSILTAKGNRETVTDLYISGPLNEADLKTICPIGNLDSLNIEEVILIDKNGNQTQEFTGLSEFKSKAGVSLPKSITKIGYAGVAHSAITAVTIPDNVTSIAFRAFDNCQDLRSVIIPDNVTSIDLWAFYDCHSLEYARLPKNRQTISEGMFHSCYALKRIDMPSVTHINKGAFVACHALEELILPETLIEIGSEAFKWCENLKPVFPKSLKKIGLEAFDGCTAITSLVLPESIETIDKYAFAHTGITEYTVPYNLPGAQGMLSGCKSLKSIQFAEGVTKIPQEFVQNCSALETVSLPESLTSIGESAFYGCTSFKNIQLPANTKTIDNNAFAYTGLETLEIPASLTKGGENMVNGCASLTSVFWQSTQCEVPILRSDDSNMLIYAPAGVANKGNINFIINNRADNIILTGNGRFHCPQPFTAAKVTFVRDFSSKAFDYNSNVETGTGKAARWQSISLPFTPSSIKAKNNGDFSKELAPFDSGKDAYPFWLRELTATGFKDVSWPEKDKAYIIAMPYNKNYLPEYNIDTEVLFMGENVTFDVTTTPAPSAGPQYSLYPNYSPITERADYLSLNEKEWTDPYENIYPAGSVFVANRNIRPFECYIKTNTATKAYFPLSNDAATRSAQKTVNKIPQKHDL